MRVIRNSVAFVGLERVGKAMLPGFHGQPTIGAIMRWAGASHGKTGIGVRIQFVKTPCGFHASGVVCVDHISF